MVRSDRTSVLYGQDYFYEELLGLKFKVSVFSFFQTNSYGAEVLYQTAREYIGNLDKEDCVVYDLYSGTGTIAQLMAPVAKKVIGVEIVEEAVEAAKKNAMLNGLDNCEFIAGDVLKVLDEIEEKPDFIILDPPRDGIHPRLFRRLSSMEWTGWCIYPVSYQPGEGFGSAAGQWVCGGEGGGGGPVPVDRECGNSLPVKENKAEIIR